MSKLLISCAAAALSGAPGAAPAAVSPIAIQRGNGLYEQCSDPGLAEQATCLAYSVGVVDGIAASSSRQTICVPDGVQLGQIRDVVTTYLREHPEQRQSQSTWLVWKSVSAAFPCPASK
jgi:hypothetical protein